MTGIDAPSELAALPDTQPPKTRPSLSFNPMSLLALVIALVALAFSFYIWLEERKIQQGLHLQQQTLHKTQETLSQQINQLQASVTVLKASRQDNEDTWLAGKARSLLELAQLELFWRNDTKTAIVLMQQADAALANMHAEGLLPVRQTLAQEIATLQAQPSQDIAGLVNQLDALRNLVPNLPVQIKTLPQTTDTAAKEPAESGWRKHLNESLDVLKTMVVIQKQDTNINPQLSALHLSLLKESIRINLQEAEWAILHNNNAVYQSALKRAITDITRHFDKEAPVTITIMKQLHTLQQITLENTKDFKQTSLAMLNDWIKNTNHSEQ